MKKRTVPATATATATDSCSASSSFSSSSSSCVVDYNDQQNKPKKARRLAKEVSAKSQDKNKSAIGIAINATPNRRSSIYRGVTRHRWTGRFEAHLWDKSCWNNIQNKKGRQVYLGAYDSEVDAARTYDLAALKYWGPETTLNFSIGNYTKEIEEMENASKEEYLATLRRRSSGFSRGVSKYRGVARHHHNGRWEARIGRVFGNKYLYLGTFSSQEEAAAAYDLAAIEYRGPNAVTNFDISNYIGRVKNLVPTGNSNLDQTTKPEEQQQQPPPKQKQKQKQKRQQKEEEEELPKLLEVGKHEEMAIIPESKLNISSNDHSPMLVMSQPDDDEDREHNPWSFYLDTTGGFENPHIVPDIPLEEDGSVLDLFDQTGFEDNIDFIFEGEGDLITMDDAYFGVTDGIKSSEESNKETEILTNIHQTMSFSSSSPLSATLTANLVSCQL